MAFTDSQIAKVMFHLNYPATSANKSVVTNALGEVSAVSSEYETEVGAIITELDAVDSAIATFAVGDAGKQVDATGVVYYRGQTKAEMENRYRHLQNRLGQICGLSFAVSESNRMVLG